MVWNSHLFQNFPQFIVIHTVKGFGIVNKAEIDVFSGTLLLWSGIPLPFHSLGAFSNPGIEPGSPTLQADSLPSESPGKPQ